MNILDYIYYRIYKFYNKKENELPRLRAFYFVTILIITIEFLVISLFNILTGGIFSNRYLDKDIFYILFFTIVGITVVVIGMRYFNKEMFVRIESRYSLHSLNKYVRIWHIFVSPIILFMITILIIIILYK